MNMKLNMKFSKNDAFPKLDLLVTLVFLFLALLFGWFFYRELSRSVDDTEGIPIGRVTDVLGLSQRRPGRQAHWVNLSLGETLYKSDSIQTGNDSELSILFDSYEDKEADEIKLGPNSFVNLNLFNDVVDIFFSAGNLIASGNEGLSVSMEGTVVQMKEKSSVSLLKNKGMPTIISVLEGSVSLDMGDGEQDYGMDSTLYVDTEGGVVSEDPLSVVVNQPKDQSILLCYNSAREVNFEWTLIGMWENPSLEISSSPDFSDSQFYEEPSATLTPGKWFWRVNDPQGDKIGESRSFTIKQERIPLIISPSPGRVIEYHKNVPIVSMQWTPANFTDSYLLELAADSQFQNVVFTREIQRTSIILDDLNAGTWWWRVSPIYRSADPGDIPDLDSQSFSLEKQEDYKQTFLLNPPKASSFSVLELDSGIPFRWLVQEGVQNYKLTVASDRDMTQIIASWEGIGNWKALMADADPGVYYWQVEGTGLDGSPVPISDIRSFSIRPKGEALRLVNPINGALVELPRYGIQTFLWESDVPGISSLTLIKLDEDPENSQKIITKALLKGESFTAVLPGEGEYSWRVQIQDEYGKVLLQDMESRFTMINEYIHDRAVLFSPETDSAIGELDALQHGVMLQWNVEEEGDFIYTVFVELDGVASVYRTEEKKLILRGLEPGSYSWIVKYQDKNQYESPESEKSSFTIEEITPLSPITVIHPERGQEIDMTGQMSLEFNWKPSPEADTYTLILREQNSREILFKAGDLEKSTYILKDLSCLRAGSFLFEIQGFKDYTEIGVQRETALVSVPFSLKLNIPTTKLEILSDETQYTK